MKALLSLVPLLLASAILLEAGQTQPPYQVSKIVKHSQEGTVDQQTESRLAPAIPSDDYIKALRASRQNKQPVITRQPKKEASDAQ